MFLVGWGLVLGFPLEKRTEKIKPQICVRCIFVTKICAVCIFEEKRLIIKYVHLRQKSIQSVSLRPKYVFAVSISAVTFFPVSAHSSASPSSFPPTINIRNIRLTYCPYTCKNIQTRPIFQQQRLYSIEIGLIFSLLIVLPHRIWISRQIW